MKVQHAIAIVFFVAAYAMYYVAGAGGAAVFVVLGILTEAAAWLTFFADERPCADDDHPRPPG